MPRGRSSAVEVAMETNTTGASWPWNLSKVPTRMWVRFSLRSKVFMFLTWAL